MDYIPNTDRDRAAMLEQLGLDSVEQLFGHIPASLRARSFNLPPGRSELEVERHLTRLAATNATALTSFLGAGFYDHFVPPALPEIIGRSEFYTAYTPYQAEISQGILQALFEYQTAICDLTGLAVSNASLYDGGTALYEAALMAVRITGRRKVVFDRGISPIYRTMLRTYTTNLSVEYRELPVRDGRADREKLARAIDRDTACLVFQNPNFFGCIDDLSDLVELAHRQGCLAVVSSYPLSLAMLKTPGEMGADIAVGEGQGLGLPLSFGGPWLGFLACREKFLRQVPGRIVGRTVDRDGRPAFVLTMQTREQHIRREKATSNICSNEALCALAAIAYLSLTGRGGLPEVARLCRDKACYLQQRLTALPGVGARFGAPFFNEFTVDLPVRAADLVSRMLAKGFAAGFPLGSYYRGMDKSLLVAVTEKRTREEMGLFVEAVAGALDDLGHGSRASFSASPPDAGGTAAAGR